MPFACRIITATDTRLEYVKVTTFLRQPWLGESTQMLPLYLYCLSSLFVYYLHIAKADVLNVGS
jgi:hypothetical protein